MLKRVKKTEITDVVEKPKGMSEKEATDLALRYNTLGKQQKLLKAEADKIKVKLDKYLDNLERDTLGNKYFQAGDLLVKRELRTKNSLNIERATEYFKRIGKFEEVAEYNLSFNEGVIEGYIKDENCEMDIDDLKAITDSKESYATVFPKKIESNEEGKV